MVSISVPRVGPERPRTRPDHVVADKGYSSPKIRACLRRRGIPHTIPERGGQPPGFDQCIYRRRNAVERCFNRLKQWRG